LEVQFTGICNERMHCATCAFLKWRKARYFAEQKLFSLWEFVTYKLFLKWPYVKQDNATEGGLNF
jgi:hypothetical protein